MLTVSFEPVVFPPVEFGNLDCDRRDFGLGEAGGGESVPLIVVGAGSVAIWFGRVSAMLD
jgi:hypothetical protein